MPGTVSALPPDAILVHIGPHKTGTTALQSMLDAARPAMAAAGVLYPGSKGAHHDEARSLRRRSAGWAHDGEAVPDPAVWDALVAEARAATGRVVISSEFFAQCEDEQRAKLVRDLGPDRVHLVMAARNPAALAVSTWQQVLRQGHNRSLETWLDRFFRRESETGKQSPFWFWADAATLAERWAAEVGPGRLNVLVLDETDRLALPRTFEELLDLPAGTLSNQVAKSNRSLTAPEAALFHGVLDRIGGDLTWEEYSRLIRGGMLLNLVEHRKPPQEERRTEMPAWAIEQAEREAASIVRRLRTMGDAVIGDLSALERGPRAAREQAPILEVPIEIAADAVAGAAEAAVRHLRRKDERIARLERRLQEQRRSPGPAAGDLSGRQLVRLLAGRVRRRATRRG